MARLEDLLLFFLLMIGLELICVGRFLLTTIFSSRIKQFTIGGQKERSTSKYLCPLRVQVKLHVPNA